MFASGDCRLSVLDALVGWASFSFSARTILELGKELISSDEVALYELIKNSVDAKSERVDITAHIMLPRANYQAALDALAGRSAMPGLHARPNATPAEVLDLIKAAVPANADPTDREAFLETLRPAIDSKESFEISATLQLRDVQLDRRQGCRRGE